MYGFPSSNVKVASYLEPTRIRFAVGVPDSSRRKRPFELTWTEKNSLYYLAFICSYFASQKKTKKASLWRNRRHSARGHGVLQDLIQLRHVSFSIPEDTARFSMWFLLISLINKYV